MPDEPRRPGKGRRSDIPWQAIREAYAAGETETSQLAKRFGCSERAIRNRKNAEKWPNNAELAQKAANKVVDIATRRTLENVGPELEKTIADNLLTHSELERSMLQIGKATAFRILKDLQEAINANRPLRHGKSSELEEIKGGIEAIMKAIDGSREVQGIKPGQPSVPAEASGDTTFKFVVIADEQTA